ncbi:MAG: hypothetical protein P1U38_01100 [Aeromicrobium sp.]|uniref:hypothetical protein n=1 Tax=Aeromicrobium sp. TaxID=1871063 RepID=UPI00260F504C|nr:hypothetical protein [Aeromicrobium sp.]MDF1703350.1 hypothetical protein [Aeromicrobium sp.]
MMQRWRDLVVVQWSVLLALLVALPWRGPGFLLSYDMVWIPTWTLDRFDLWGTGSAVPRAVPSDGVVAVLSQVVDPVVLQRVMLIGALALGGVGAARLVDHLGLGARLVAATYALWNPFVAERLVLGQWPVIIALACLPWIVVAVRDPRHVRGVVLTLALAGTALSVATGLMGLVVALVAGWRSGVLRIVVLALALNAPWIVATAVRLAPVESDPAGVRAFAAQSEGPLGHAGTMASLGGVWNTEVVPSSRTTAVAAVLVVVLLLVLVAGVVHWARSDRRLLAPLATLAVLGHAIAAWGWLSPGTLEDLVAWQGSAGVLRDGTRYLALAVPFHVVALAYGARLLGRRVAGIVSDGRWAVVGTAAVLALPLAALPDLANGVDGRLTPVEYPDDWAAAASVIAASDVPGDLLTLPFQPYRSPEWNRDRTVIDPAARFFDRETVASDALTVSGTTLASEDPRARDVAAVLADPAATPARLGALGIGLVVVDVEAQGEVPLPAAVAAAREIGPEGSDLRVLAIDGARSVVPTEEAELAVTAGWALAALTVGIALLVAASRGVGRLRRLVAAGRRTSRS